jgi:hypothetical protein
MGGLQTDNAQLVHLRGAKTVQLANLSGMRTELKHKRISKH